MKKIILTTLCSITTVSCGMIASRDITSIKKHETINQSGQQIIYFIGEMPGFREICITKIENQEPTAFVNDILASACNPLEPQEAKSLFEELQKRY